jgi:hypothetical protein
MFVERSVSLVLAVFGYTKAMDSTASFGEMLKAIL